MKYNIGDRITVTDAAYISSGLNDGIIAGGPVNTSTGVIFYKIRFNGYCYRNGDDYHYMSLSKIKPFNSMIYKCPICKKYKCSTSECD